jgi:hypothetical protein
MFPHSSFTLKDKKLSAKVTDLFGSEPASQRLIVQGKKMVIEFIQMSSDSQELLYYSPTLECLSNHPECRGYRVILKK